MNEMKRLLESKKAVRMLKIAGPAVILLFLLGIALPAVFASSHLAIEEILNGPSIIDKYKDMQKDSAKETDEESPLVIAAKAFGNYLNPPARVTAPSIVPRGGDVRPTVRPAVEQTESSVRFTLLGTSFFESKPELSCALIDQPGKGVRWVKQSSKIGHHVIEEIKNGSIVVVSGTQRSEILALKQAKNSLIKSMSPELAEKFKDIQLSGNTGVIESTMVMVADNSSPGWHPPTKHVQVGQQTEPINNEQLLADLKQMQEELEDDEASKMLAEFMAQIQNTNVDTNEAQQLGNLGETLNNESPKPVEPAVQSPPDSAQRFRRIVR